MFQVFFTWRADKELGKLSQKLKQKIYNEIKTLSEDPFSPLGLEELNEQNLVIAFVLDVGEIYLP